MYSTLNLLANGISFIKVQENYRHKLMLNLHERTTKVEARTNKTRSLFILKKKFSFVIFPISIKMKKQNEVQTYSHHPNLYTPINKS